MLTVLFPLYPNNQQHQMRDLRPHFPSSLSAANIDSEREPSPYHRLLKAKFTLYLPSGSVQHVCMCISISLLMAEVSV